MLEIVKRCLLSTAARWGQVPAGTQVGGNGVHAERITFREKIAVITGPAPLVTNAEYG